MNAQHSGQLSPAIFSTLTRHAFALGTTQAGDQILAQLPVGHGIDADVDGLLNRRYLSTMRRT